MNFAKFLRTSFLKEHLQWLLLKLLRKSQPNFYLHYVSRDSGKKNGFLYKKKRVVKNLARSCGTSNSWNVMRALRKQEHNTTV